MHLPTSSHPAFLPRLMSVFAMATLSACGGGGGGSAVEASNCADFQSGVDLRPGTTSAPACSDGFPVTLTYAAGADHQLDLIRPTGAGPWPTIVWIHGGGWRSGSRGQVEQVRRLVCQGYAVASVDYRLSDVAPFPAQIHDVKAAIRYLRANAATLQIDGNRLATFGSSAGGHLATLAATSSGVSDLEDLTLGNAGTSSAVAAAAAWYGPTDFGQMDAQLRAQGCAADRSNHSTPTSAESELLGCVVGTPGCAAAVARANPVSYVGPATPPLYLLHGKEDCTVPRGQTTALKAAVDAAGRCASSREVIGADHGGPEWQTTPVQDAMAQFFNAVLKP
jgi:acetyl esterase/lipase